MGSRYLTTAEAADYLRFETRSAVTRLVHEGRLRSAGTRGRTMLFEEADLDAFVRGERPQGIEVPRRGGATQAAIHRIRQIMAGEPAQAAPVPERTSMSTDLVPLRIEHEGARWPLWRQPTGAEPLAMDLDLARWLEFTRPHEIRRLIERHAPLLGEVFVTVTKTSARGGRPGKAYYLTEGQALFLAAKSETPKATTLLKTMIQVFMLARRGLLQPAHALDEAQVRRIATEAALRAVEPFRVALEQSTAALREVTRRRDALLQLRARVPDPSTAAEFISASVAVDGQREMRTSELYGAYVAACRAGRTMPVSIKKFSQTLRAAGYRRRERSAGTFWNAQLRPGVEN